ncbi:GNAT family N-acetyltransferase [Alteromonas sp. H39]|uniref:GNAT family N-acetyltransferase n=1 Tax=Alteromonas sp. H39 TaxID=3389876 RepID=UPI0039E09271
MQELINWVFFPNGADKSECLHRQCLLLSHDNAIAQAKDILAFAPASTSLCWLGDNAPASAVHVPITQYRRLLGQEFNVAVYNAFAPFRPSALLALAGTIRSGGRLIIACPPLLDWPRHCEVLDTHFVSHGWQLNASRYIQHWIELALQDSAVAIFDAHQQRLPVKLGARQEPVADDRFITHDQRQTYEALVKTSDSAIITAPRGRGKTALLGEFAATLLANGESVMLTSKHFESVQPLIDRLRARADLTEIAAGQFRHNANQVTLNWVAPDNPQLQCRDNGVLIIDEAASMPLPQIQALIELSARIILATTTEGYEGSGQGFLHRFMPHYLAKKNATYHHLKTPIRWLENDPLERLTSVGLLFSPEEPARYSTGNTPELTLNWADFSALSKPVTHRVMQLLIQAHYQTTPDDLMRLLDAPDIKLLLATHRDNVVGATIINMEGGPRLEEVASGIACGSRRVKGHLSAQRIALMLSAPEAATALYWRINRIAVAPEHQNHGYGSQMLAKVTADATLNKIDAITSSFGYTELLGRFWQTNGLDVIQHGVKKDKASGHASALVFRAISQRAQQFKPLLQAIKTQEDKALGIVSLSSEYSRFSKDVAARLPSLHISKLQQFVAGTRDSVQCMGSLHWLADSLKNHLAGQRGTADLKTEFPLLDYLHDRPFDSAALQRYGALSSKAEMKRALQAQVNRALSIYVATASQIL